MSASEDRALKAHHSTAQGQALGHLPSTHFPSPERAILLGFALTGLIAPFPRNPGLCPGLSNGAPLGLGTFVGRAFVHSHDLPNNQPVLDVSQPHRPMPPSKPAILQTSGSVEQVIGRLQQTCSSLAQVFGRFKQTCGDVPQGFRRFQRACAEPLQLSESFSNLAETFCKVAEGLSKFAEAFRLFTEGFSKQAEGLSKQEPCFRSLSKCLRSL